MPKSKTKKYSHNLTHPLLSAMACLTNGYINNPLHKTCQKSPIELSLHLGSSISLQFGNQPVKQFLTSLISLKAVARGLYLKAILLLGSTFRKRVWNELLKIPYGSTVSYGAIAQRLAIAQPEVCVSARAVGGAVAHNPISLIVPCHRVVGGNGSLTGYAGGLEKKVQLLQMERSLASPALEEMRKDSSSKQFVDDFPFVKYH